MGNGNGQNGNHNTNGHHPNGHVNLNGNGVADIGGHDPASSAGLALLWDGLPPAVVSALEQPLDPALVSRRDGRGNRSYDYIEGHTAIDEANRIFGYGGWGYELMGEVSLRRMERVDVRTGEVKVNYAYSAPVRVSVVGAPPRTDIGFHVVTDDNPEGHETAVKGAVTDGLKRALRSFGDRFGNGLYGDQPTSNNRAGAPPSNARGNGNNGQGRRDGSYLQQLRGRLIALGAEQGFDEERVRDAVKKQTGRDLDDLPAKDLKPLVENAARKVNEAKAAEGSG
ncbi:MAG: hypothetical protein F4Z05_06040 [Chloroflexi bacterium]|nr:hypothetical protein [Chloroflexota bacterium]